MITKLLVLSVLLLAPLLSLAAGDNADYYSARPDLRKCASPLCGGIFVQSVNRRTTRCADGRLRPECYVAEVDLAALALPPDEEATVREHIQNGTVLLKGRLAGKPFAPFGDLGEFEAAEVWQAATDARPTGAFLRALDTGVVCIAAPCLSFQEFKLNSFAQRAIAGVDLSPVGAGDQELAAAHEALLTEDGILVAGTHTVVSGPAGTAPALTASQFYLPVRSGKPR